MFGASYILQASRVLSSDLERLSWEELVPDGSKVLSLSFQMVLNNRIAEVRRCLQRSFGLTTLLKAGSIREGCSAPCLVLSISKGRNCTAFLGNFVSVFSQVCDKNKFILMFKWN